MDNYTKWCFGSPEKVSEFFEDTTDNIYNDTKNSKESQQCQAEVGTRTEKNDGSTMDNNVLRDNGVNKSGGRDNLNEVDDSGNNPELLHWNRTMSKFGIKKEPMDLRNDDLLNSEFETLHDAEIFFNLYAKWIGFSIRKGHKRMNMNGEIVMRQWLCSREGSCTRKYMVRNDRVREPKAITRVGCKVSFRVVQNKYLKTWRVKEFVTEHSHRTTSLTHLQFLRSNRKVGGGALMTAMSMRGAGIRTCHIMSYIAEMSGGYDKVPFIRQDLYNRIGSYESVELADADASRAMGYLHHKADHDANFYAKYSYDEYYRLKNVVWSDLRCQNDYCYFGHALAFDTTYRTNSYGKPLLVFVGINHHFKTVVFAFALMIDETIDSYRWVTQYFLECMKGVQPETVITDGDKAMAVAIRELMPKDKHRLCSLHIKQNGIKNVLDGGFNSRLQRLMFRYYTDEQFDIEWLALVKDFSLSKNEWACRLYESRKQWAESYLRDSFFGGMTTTQRCESMNSMLKKNVEERMKLSEFVRRIDIALSSLRHTESKDDFDSTNSSPFIGSSNMRTIEEQASQIFTRAIFFRVRDEMKREGKYMVRSTSEYESVITCKLIKYCDESKTRRVKHNRQSLHFSCECNFFPSKGFPCRHIFAAMKYLNISKIPDSLILKRWTINAKGVGVMKEPFLPPCKYTCAQESSRFAHVSNRAAELSFYAAGNDEIFKLANKILDEGIAQVRTAWEGYRDDESSKRSRMKTEIKIRNPVFTRTKGTSFRRGYVTTGKKKCSICNKIGHNKTTCKRRMKNKNFRYSNTVSSQSYAPSGSEVNLEDDSEIWLHKEWRGSSKQDLNMMRPSQSGTTGMFTGRSNTQTTEADFPYSEMEGSISDYDTEDYPFNEVDKEDWWGTPEASD